MSHSVRMSAPFARISLIHIVGMSGSVSPMYEPAMLLRRAGVICGYVHVRVVLLIFALGFPVVRHHGGAGPIFHI